MEKNIDINLNLYKIFYEVAKCENISNASKKLYLTQSAVSKAIKNIEKDFNTTLFYRTSKGVKLTEKGEELLYYVEEALNNLKSAERTMLEQCDLSKGKLSIGVPSQIGSFFIFENIEKFYKQYPNIKITIVSKGTKELLTLLKRHEIDFIIDTSPIITNQEDIIIKKLTNGKNVFVVNSNSKIDTNSIKSIKDLENYPLVLPIDGTNNRKELDNAFLKNKTKIKNYINIHTSEMIVGAVKKDLGIGYIIYDVVKDNLTNKELKVVKVKEQLPKTEINLVYIKKYLTTTPKYFITNYLNVEL